MTGCRLKMNKKHPALWLFLIAVFIAAPAAETDVAAQIPQKVNASQARVKELERNLAFERHWGKELGKALQMTDKLSAANSELGSLFRVAADVFSSGASEDMIKEKIGKVNDRIKPYFRVDDRGNLHWGSALQVGIMMSGTVPPQFAVGLPKPPPLTLKEAVGILNGWQQKNQQQMRKNEQELKTLLAEPSKPPDEETRGETAAQGPLEGYRGQLNALTARLKKVEGTFPEFEREKTEYKAKWAEEELTMKLHLATAQKAGKEASKADDIIRSINLGAALISESLGEAKQITGSVEEKTASLNFIYSAYAVAAMKVSDAANKVCDYASSAASQPSPTADEIAGWISESGDLITGASDSVEYADKEVAERIESLDPDISRLRTILDNLSSARLAILADFNRLEQIKSNLDEAEKDIKRAEEMRANYLNTYVSEMKRIQGGREKDLKGLGKDADVLAQAVRGRDRQLEAGVAQLQARIKAAANIVRMDMPSRPPEVPELSPEFHDLRTKLEGLDEKKSAFEEKFAPVDSAITAGRKAISDAEGAVVAGAFATKNAPADLERARQCYASLKGAPPEEETVARGPLAALKKRLAVVEGEIPELTRLKARYDEEQKSAAKSIKAHIDRARQLMDEADAIAAEMYSRLLGRGTPSVNPSETVRLTQELSARTQEFEAAYERFARAAGNATKTRDEICGYKEKASASPPPSTGEVKAWKGKSTRLIEQTAIALKIAADEVSGKRVAVNALAGELKPLLDDYKSAVTSFIAVEKTVEKLRKDMDDAEKELKGAEEIRNQEAISRLIALYNEYRNGMIDEVLAIISELNVLGETADGKLKPEVLKLTGRAKSAKQRLTGMPELHLFEKLPEVPRFSTPKHVSELDALYQVYYIPESENIRPANQIIANGRKAISDAVSAHELGRYATERAPQILEEARQCYASLQKAEEAIQKIEEKLYADAQAALDSCDFEKARSLIDQMPVGSKRTEIDQKHQASISLENRLKALVGKANGEYGSRNYEAALSILDKALLEATCERHLESINKKIAIVNAAVLKVYNNAQAALNSCDFERARKLIDQMPAGPKRAGLDQKYQASISLENRLKTLVGKANGEYGSRNYEAALSILRGALKQAKCDRHRESINNKIAKVMGKLAPPPEEQVATTVPPVRGENVEIAKMIIRDAKMVPSVNRKKRTSNENEVDKVYAQKPSAGSPATQGDTVIIYVYSKAKSVQPGTQKGRDTGIDSMVGRWNMRPPGAVELKKSSPWARPYLFFTKERGEFGYKIQADRGRVKLWDYWDMQGGELVFKDSKTGRVMWQFTRKGEGYWEGYKIESGSGRKVLKRGLARPREFYEERERDSSPGGVGAFDSSSGITDPKRRQQLLRGMRITPHPKR